MQETGVWFLGREGPMEKEMAIHSSILAWEIPMKDRGDWWDTAELFQILKDDGVKVLHSMWQQIWKTQQWPQDWKKLVIIPVPKKGNTKECSTTTQLHLFHTLAKVMLKSSQDTLQQYMNGELPDVQAGFRKGR